MRKNKSKSGASLNLKTDGAGFYGNYQEEEFAPMFRAETMRRTTTQIIIRKWS